MVYHIFFALAIVVGLASPAFAVPSERICDGKYRVSEEIVDAAYRYQGTIYSVDSIDLYRLLAGLPDHQFRTSGAHPDADKLDSYWVHIAPKGGYFRNDALSPEWTAFALDHALAVATHPGRDPRLDETLYWVEYFLYQFTISGPSPDWWLTGDQDDLNPIQWTIAQHARRSSLLDWLHGALITSAFPLNAEEHLRTQRWIGRPDFTLLADHYWARFKEDGGLQWAVLFIQYRPDDLESEALRQNWQKKVEHCSASQAEYAAFAISYFEGRQRKPLENLLPETHDLLLLPPELRNQLIEREARAYLARTLLRPKVRALPADDDAYLERLTNLVADSSGVSYIFAPITIFEIRMMRQRGIEGVADLFAERGLHNINPIAINLLETNDMILIADRLGDHAEHIVDLRLTIFARLVALGRWKDAEDALADYFRVFPEDSANCGHLLELDGPLDGRLALIALCIPDLSVEFRWTYRHYRDNPKSTKPFVWEYEKLSRFSRGYRDGTELTSYVERLLGVGNFWEMQDGFGWGSLSRNEYRNLKFDLLEPDFFIYPSSFRGHGSGIPFGVLVARGELESLGPENGLIQKLSEAVIHWADEGSDTIPEAMENQSGPLPDALRKIVLLNRFRQNGDVDGMFAGKAAWRLLHLRFPFSHAARETRYWYDCRGRRSCQW